MLTKQQRNSIAGAIADCDRYIGREEKRAADLRPVEIAERLAWYRAHRAKLEQMLADDAATIA